MGKFTKSRAGTEELTISRTVFGHFRPRTSNEFPVDALHIMADYGRMISKHVTLADPVAEAIEAQISSGRYKDASAALNDAAWQLFVGVPSPFTEYGVTPGEVERCAARMLKEIDADRKAEKLLPL
jgi:hypothetical protein